MSNRIKMNNSESIKTIRRRFPIHGDDMGEYDTVFKLVEEGRGATSKRKEEIYAEVIRVLEINPEIVFRHLFESCSLVIGFNDKKTVLEICSYPRTISHFIDTEHIFFK